jgi:myo-inositol-1(or 4)-monophosphatase
MNPTLAEIETLARQAGEILRRAYSKGVEVQHKGVIDLVTEADHQSEDFLIGQIHAHYPNQKIVAEESGVLPGDGQGVWYIDPLDGTVNFAHGVPFFSVSIGFAIGGKVVMGAVYEPLRDELFSAQAGQGARLNGAPIQPSGCATLDQALLVTGFPYDVRTSSRNNIAQYGRFALVSQGVRRLGSAALDSCYIACGRFDGYWELSVQTYDIAAGALIAQEAGAVVSKADGRQDLLTPPCSILAAATPALYAQMLPVI